MDTTNNPVEGTGSGQTENQTLSFTELLDSDTATTQDVISKDEETEVSNATDEDEDFDADTVSDQDSEAEEDSESEDATDEDNEAGDDFQIPPDAMIKLRDGTTVNGQELLDSYERREVFTRKTQELAVERKAYVDNRVDLTQVHRDYAESINRLQDVMMVVNSGMQEPDWDDLRVNDPHDFLIKQGEWDKKVQLLNALDSERSRIAAEEERTSTLVRAHAQQNAYKLLMENAPEEFGTPELAKSNLGRVEDYLTKYCHFEQGAVDQISDPRLILIALDALQWREHKQKVPEAVKRIEQKPALVMPGATGGKKSSGSTFESRIREAQKTGNNRNLFLHLLDNE